MRKMFWDHVGRRTSLEQGDAFEEGQQALPSLPISHQERWPEHDSPRKFSRDASTTFYLGAIARANVYRPGLKLRQTFDAFSKQLGLLSKAEARFWIRAVCDERSMQELKDTSDSGGVRTRAKKRLDKIDVDEPLTCEETGERFDALFYGGERASRNHANYGFHDFAPLALCLRAEFGVIEGLRAIFESLNPNEYNSFFYHFGSTQGHEEEAIALMHEYLDESACFAMRSRYTRVMANVLERCPDPGYLDRAKDVLVRYSWSIERARARLPMIWSEQEDVFAWIDLLKSTLSPQQARDLYARFGEDGLDELMKRVTGRYNKDGRDELVRALLPVANKKMTPWMLELAQKEESRELARHWLYSEGVHATLGLMELVKSRGKRRNQAIAELRVLVEQGHADEIRGLLEQVTSPTAKELITQEVLDFKPEHIELAVAQELPAWATSMLDDSEFLEELDTHVVSGFFELESAPVVTLVETGHALPVELMTRVLALAQGAMPRPKKRGKKHSEMRTRLDAIEKTCRGWLAQIRADVDGEQLGAWLWYVLEMWWSKKKPHSMASCLALVGYCASDRELVELVPRIKSNKKWFPAQDTRRHVCEVLDGFAMVGTTTGRMWLDEFAVNGPNKWARKHARDAIDAICEARGWSEAQWQDRIVSHAGLNERGTRVFDYGGRRFELRFRGAFDVEFVGEDGDHFERLPPARKSDDVDMVRAARQDYKSIKTQIDQVIARQTVRFERAMIDMQRWPAQAWWTWVARHPLLHHFARKLVWVKQVDGEPDEYVVLTQEGTLIDVGYEEVECPEQAYMRLLHPVELDADQRRDWVELMADFEIVQPFAQLEREVFDRTHRFDEIIEVLGTKDWWRWLSVMDDDYGTRYWRSTYQAQAMSALWRAYGPWCGVILCDVSGWGEGHEGELPEPGMYVCRGQEPDPGAIVPLEELPEPFYSEMYREARKFLSVE